MKENKVWCPIFTSTFREQLSWWYKSDATPRRRKAQGNAHQDKDRKICDRVLDLVEATIADPIKGIGKPEKLKYLPGSRWSRRITQEHRLVYQVSDDKLIFLQCRYHY